MNGGIHSCGHFQYDCIKVDKHPRFRDCDTQEGIITVAVIAAIICLVVLIVMAVLHKK